MFYIFTLQQDIDKSGFFKRQQMKKKKNENNRNNVYPI